MNTCVNCKHCEIITGDYGDVIECKKYYTVDPVLGYKNYKKCRDIRNIYNNCSLFERKVSILERIINWFKKLWQKLMKIL